MSARLVIEDVSKHFDGVTALSHVSLEIEEGERRAVIGPNGAGKTTLLRIISGDTRPSSGRIWMGGARIDGLSPDHLARRGIGRTFQRSSTFAELSALENVELARMARRGETARCWRPVQASAASREALEQVGLAEKARWPAGRLSHGEKRQLELAMALVQRPRVLLLDEPLAGLSPYERTRIAALLQQLPRDLTVLLIEHDLGFVQGFADRITVLHHGEVVAEGTPGQVRNDPRVQEVYVGKGTTLTARPGRPAGTTLLAVHQLHAGYGPLHVLDGVSLRIGEGEAVALLGRNGMGKTTLLLALMGLLPSRGGSITFGSRPIGDLPAHARAQLGIACVPQGRRMLSGLRVEEELRLAASTGRWTVERVYQLFPQLQRRRLAWSTSLSGGEQQMLAIARALLRNPRLLLMDEPSEGLSPLLVRHVAEVMVGLRDEAETILMAEQNVELALAVAHRAYVLERGRVVYDGVASDLVAQPDLVRHRLGVA